MRTAEEIARAAAEEGVTRGESEPGAIRTISVGTYVVSNYALSGELDHLRKEVAKLVLAAIEEYARQAPLPGLLSDERLAEMREADRACASDDLSKYPLVGDRRELLAEVDFLRRIMADDVPSAASRIAHEKAREVERLKAVLKEIASGEHFHNDMEKMAREALEEKP